MLKAHLRAGLFISLPVPSGRMSPFLPTAYSFEEHLGLAVAASSHGRRAFVVGHVLDQICQQVMHRPVARRARASSRPPARSDLPVSPLSAM